MPRLELLRRARHLPPVDSGKPDSALSARTARSRIREKEIVHRSGEALVGDLECRRRPSLRVVQRCARAAARAARRKRGDEGPHEKGVKRPRGNRDRPERIPYASRHSSFESTRGPYLGTRLKMPCSTRGWGTKAIKICPEM